MIAATHENPRSRPFPLTGTCGDSARLALAPRARLRRATQQLIRLRRTRSAELLFQPLPALAALRARFAAALGRALSPRLPSGADGRQPRQQVRDAPAGVFAGDLEDAGAAEADAVEGVEEGIPVDGALAGDGFVTVAPSGYSAADARSQDAA